jgi:hypothetical protein
MFNGNQIFSIVKKKGACHMFLKKWHKLAFYGDQKISIAIGVMQKVTEFFFRRHLTCPHHQMASKIF